MLQRLNVVTIIVVTISIISIVTTFRPFRLKYSGVKSKLLEFQDAGLRRLQIDGRKCPENLPMTFAGELPEFYTPFSERAIRKTSKIDRIFIFHLFHCNIKVQKHNFV